MPQSRKGDSPRTRRTIHFTGRVQGVGFRQTTAEIAASFDVTGAVRNLPDGRVELIVEGTIEQVAGFHRAIETRMASNLRGVDAADSPASGEFPDFRIAW